MNIVLAYIPVPHRGYRDFFERNQSWDALYLVGEELQNEFPHLVKNIPALSTEEVSRALTAMWFKDRPVIIADASDLAELNTPYVSVVAPDEDVTRDLIEKHMSRCRVRFDSVFLRWDRNATLAKGDVLPDYEVSSDAFDADVMDLAEAVRRRSADFWRQVGGVLVRDRKVLLYAYNRHLPTDMNPYYFGDPRFNFSRGIEIELGTAIHAERDLLSTAARRGIATEGAFLYITTFPCAPCAKALVVAGISACYFRGGYTNVDSESVMKAFGVKIVKIKNT